jgi:ubiquinone/menaquinone biosynthesis C-methylase UbiE
MSLGTVLVIVVVVTSIAVYGSRRIQLPRKSGPEGIEDPEAVEAYDHISTWPQFRLLRRMIATKLGTYKPEGVLADIGCGPGRLTILVAQRHPNLRVIGVDTSDEMIRRAGLDASSLGLTNRVEYRRGDVTDLSTVDGTVDFVVSTLSLHHWSDPDRGLGEIHRILKPRQQLLLFDLRRDCWQIFYWLISFAQSVVVPAKLRQVNEPLCSLLSSYTVDELQCLFARGMFSEWEIEGGIGWAFVWAAKGSPR